MCGPVVGDCVIKFTALVTSQASQPLQPREYMAWLLYLMEGDPELRREQPFRSS
jgi:hypothetical protein